MSSTQDETQQTATEYEAHEGGDEMERQGHLLFGFICDMRIAVVFLNIFNIFAICVGILVTGLQFHSLGAAWYAFENGFLSIALSVVGALGALNYVLWMVGVATLGFAFGFLIDLFGLHLIGILVGGLVLYPHVVLTYEIHGGIMSKETYAREEHIVENDFIKV